MKLFKKEVEPVQKTIRTLKANEVEYDGIIYERLNSAKVKIDYMDDTEEIIDCNKAFLIEGCLYIMMDDELQSYYIPLHRIKLWKRLTSQYGVSDIKKSDIQ